MRLIFVSQSLPFPIYKDGLTVRVFHLLREFKTSIDCHLIAFDDGRLTRQMSEQLNDLCSWDAIPYHNHQGIFSSLRKAISFRRFCNKQFRQTLKARCESLRPDIVFFEQTFMAQYSDCVGQTPRVMSAVDALYSATLKQALHCSNTPKKLATLILALQRAVFEYLHFKDFDCLTAVSAKDAKHLLSLTGKEVQVFPNGVDVQFFSPDHLAAQRNVVLFTGNLSSAMNEEASIYLFKEIYPALHQRLPWLEFAIVGRAPTKAIFDCRPDFVTIYEDVDDLRAVLRKCILYLAPVVSGAGIKNNVLQAMAMGIPVITTPLVADPIGIEDGRTGLIATQRHDMTEMAQKLLLNKEELDAIGHESHKHIRENFTWSSVASRYISLFERIVAGRREEAKILQKIQ